MPHLATAAKITLAVAGMLAAAAVIAFAVTTALSRAGEPPPGGATAVAGGAGSVGGGAGGPAGGASGTAAPEPGKPTPVDGWAAGLSLSAQEVPARVRRGDHQGDRPRISRRADRDSRLADRERIEWRRSVAVGLPHDGRLVRGVQLPAEGRHFFTWDPIHKTTPNRGWRRWGTDKLIRTIRRVSRDFARANPGAPRITVGDLSRPRGGDFGPQFGSLGHASHQNGLDADIYYPLRSGRERGPRSVDEVDMRLAQDLVDRFVRAGAVKIFVGPNTPLTGPPDIVQPLVHHDGHLHVRLE